MKHSTQNIILFVAVVVAVLLLDATTKQIVDAYPLGSLIVGPFLELIDFRLVHNTGAAWGMFGDSTFALGIVSLVVCAGLFVYFLFAYHRASFVEVLGLALIVAGGLGNAIDRFTLGYVVDFIHILFIDFPTFNIADIAVTCGFVLFIAGLFWGKREHTLSSQHPLSEHDVHKE